MSSPSPDNYTKKDELPLMEHSQQKNLGVKVGTQKGDVKVSVADLVELCSRHATLSWCPRFEVALLEKQRGIIAKAPAKRKGSATKDKDESVPKN